MLMLILKIKELILSDYKEVKNFTVYNNYLFTQYSIGDINLFIYKNGEIIINNFYKWSCYLDTNYKIISYSSASNEFFPNYDVIITNITEDDILYLALQNICLY